MSHALIFGINGQDGFYLAGRLREQQIAVTGISRSPGEWIQGDVADRDFVERLIRDTRPDYVFHLAAHSKTGHELLGEHQSTIVQGSLHILESVSLYVPDARVFITGSGLQFENRGEPINEQTPFSAQDAYSLARIQSVYAARYYRSRGIRTYVGYLFHHDSPLRTSQHLNRRIADAARAAGSGKDYPLAIGDISIEKEFGFAGDIARGIWQLVQQENITEACIGTGKAYPISKWLELCFGIFGKNWQAFVTSREGYQADFKRLVSDPGLLMSAGWQPEVSIEELARMMTDPSNIR